MIRIVLILGAPFVIAWAFSATLVKEIGMAFVMAWLSAREEAGEVGRIWRNGPDAIERKDLP